MMAGGFAPKGDMSDDRKPMIHLCPTCTERCEGMNCEWVALDSEGDEVYECHNYEADEEAA